MHDRDTFQYRIAPGQTGNAVFLFYGGIPMQTKTKRLTESAMLIALAVVLELAGKSIIPPMPFGGQLTLCAMLPLC